MRCAARRRPVQGRPGAAGASILTGDERRRPPPRGVPTGGLLQGEGVHSDGAPHGGFSGGDAFQGDGLRRDDAPDGWFRLGDGFMSEDLHHDGAPHGGFSVGDAIQGRGLHGDDAPGNGYRPGHRGDFDRLYRASYSRILFTLVAMLGDHAAAEDCAQETYVKAFRAWPRWTPDAPAEAWVHRIAVNAALSHRRHSRLREIGETLRRLGRPGDGPDPAADAVAGSALFAALRALPQEQAALVVLRHHHGYSNREIAVALGVPESTVSSRLVAAKRRLREALTTPEPADPRVSADKARRYSQSDARFHG